MNMLGVYQPDFGYLLDGMIYNLQPGRGGMTCLIFNPVQAKALAKAGWTKDEDGFLQKTTTEKNKKKTYFLIFLGFLMVLNSFIQNLHFTEIIFLEKITFNFRPFYKTIFQKFIIG